MAEKLVRLPDGVHINRTVISGLKPVDPDRKFRSTDRIVRIRGGKLIESPFDYKIPPVKP